MHEKGTGAVLVVDDKQKLVGIFTGRDAVRILAEGHHAPAMTLAEAMTPDPHTIAPDQTSIDALREMNDRGFRQLEPHARAFLYRDPSGELVSKTVHAGAQLTWDNGAFFEYAFEPRREVIRTPFVLPPATIPIGSYDWNQHLLVFESDHSRALSGSVRATIGEFWSGTQRTAQMSVLYRPTYRLLFDLGAQVSDITLESPHAAFTTTLTSLRTSYSFNRSMFLDSLLQYRNDVRQFSANVRFNLIHRPLSDLFIVYNESQFSDLEQPAGRGIIVKYTHMLAF